MTQNLDKHAVMVAVAQVLDEKHLAGEKVFVFSSLDLAAIKIFGSAIDKIYVPNGYWKFGFRPGPNGWKWALLIASQQATPEELATGLNLTGKDLAPEVQAMLGVGDAVPVFRPAGDPPVVVKNGQLVITTNHREVYDHQFEWRLHWLVKISDNYIIQEVES